MNHRFRGINGLGAVRHWPWRFPVAGWNTAVINIMATCCMLLLFGALTAFPATAAADPPTPLTNIVAFTPNLDAALIAVSSDARTLTFRPGNDSSRSRLAMIGVDSLLLAPAGRRFPDGLAVRVRSIRHDDRNVTLRVAPVTLADLDTTGEGRQVALQPSDVESVQLEVEPEPSDPAAHDGRSGAGAHAGTRQVRLSPRRRPETPVSGSANDPTTHSLAAPVETDRAPAPEFSLAPAPTTGAIKEPGNNGSRTSAPTSPNTWWARVRERAIFSTGARLEWNQSGITGSARVRIENPVLVFRRDELSFAGRLVAESQLGFLPAHGLSFKQVFLSVRLKPIPLGFVGPVPLYVRPRLRVLVKGRITGTIGCAGHFDVAIPFVSGARRSAGRWTNISRADARVTPQQVRLDGSVGELSAKLFVGVAVDFFINDLAGPTVRAGVYVSPGAAATLIKSPTASDGVLRTRPLLSVFKIKGGAELSIGGALGFLDGAGFLVDVVRAELPLYRLKLAGLDVQPSTLRLSGRAGLEPSAVRLVPVYRQTLIDGATASVRLDAISGECATWDPPPGPDGRLSGPGQRGTARFRCTLPLVDKTLDAVTGSLDLVGGD